MKEKIMILGAGRGQVPLIDICKKYGLETIVVSVDGDYPGFSIADRIYKVDIKEKDKILSIAKDEGVIGIVTTEVDAAVPIAAYVSDKLQLPSIGYDVSLKFTNKYIMCQEAGKLDIDIPEFSAVSSIDEAISVADRIGYPLIMKPADGTASKGVFKVQNSDELNLYFNESLKCSDMKKVLIEEFISGQEYVIEAFTNNYQVTNLIVGHRDYFDLPNIFIPKASVFIDANSAISDIEKRILEINKTLIIGFGLKFGITHAEYIYNKQMDKIYLIEIAARGGGVRISSDLIPLGCGINAEKLLVEAVLGKIEENETTKLIKGSSAYFTYLLPEGKIVRIENAEKIEEIEGVHRAFFDNIYVGMNIPKVSDKSSRKGPILVYGKTKKECYDVIDKVKNVLKIEVETPTGEIQGIQW
ncbi:MAG: ATP-grasp domain-containing protein [Bacteroidales bacterium]|jgi:biotin carboxylase|nr:ATP-grasp domain-containing protein [Bacteroidales bacterium]